MKRFAVGLTAAVIGGTMLLTGGTASAARTALDVEIADISPNPVVVPKGGEATVKIDVIASDDAKKVELSVRPLDSQARTLAAKQSKLDQQGQHWVFSVPFTDGDPTGRWRATVVATDKDGKTDTDKATFAVEAQQGKADTRIARFDASPEPVRKGRTLWFSGRLQANEDGDWEGVKGAEVAIYFRRDGSSGWKWVADTETRWGGKFTAKTRAYKSGQFKAVYEGDDDTNGSTSAQDYVRVRGGWHH